MFKFIKIPVFVLLFSAVFGGVISHFNLTEAESKPSDWFSQTSPQISGLENVLGSLPEALSNNNIDCLKQKIITKKPNNIASLINPFSKAESFEACSVNTRFGAISSNGYLVRSKTDIGGEVYDALGKKVIPIAIPNSERLIYIEPGTGGPGGGQLRVVENAEANINSIFNDGSVKHYVSPQANSYIIKDQVGNPALIISSGLAFSGSGNFMIGRAPNFGLFRYNFFDKSLIIFNSNTSSDPGLAISGASLSNEETKDGRYIAVNHPTVGFRVFDINSCVANVQLNKVATCQSKNFLSYLEQNIPNYLGIGRPRFTDPYSIRFFAVSRGSNNTTKLAFASFTANGHTKTSFGYLALGDSFASGEGIYEYRQGTDVKDPYNKCHLSQKSYPYLIGSSLGLSESQSVACSGAVIKDIGLSSEDRGLKKDPQSKGLEDSDNYIPIIKNFLPGYRTQMSFVFEKRPTVITISAAGNDIGFGDILERCVVFPDTCYEHYEDRFALVETINKQFDRLAEMYDALRKSSDPSAKIYVIGYPSLMKNDGDCGANVHANGGEVKFSNELISYLNLVIKKAAERAGVSFVDTENAFEGFRLCENDPYRIAVNGLSLGNDTILDIGPIGKESYHPNAKGHELFKTAILDKTSNFSLVNPAPNPNAPGPTPNDANDFLKDKPYSGHYYYSSRTDNIEVSEILQKFIDQNIKTEGYAPGSFAEIQIHSTPTTLATVQADSSGNIDTNINLPASIEPGFHEIHVFGKDLIGQEIDSSKLVYVAANENDYDGDGIENSQDKCLVIKPSGIDEDKDNVDDACDGFIAEPPAVVETPAPETGTVNIIDVPEELAPIPPIADDLPAFESFPEKEIGNNETVAGNEPVPDTISGVDNSNTDQAPNNAGTLQPGSTPTQGSSASLQTGGASSQGGNSSINNLLSQGTIVSQPLDVGVANASTGSKTAPVALVSSQSNKDFGGPWVFLLIGLFIILLLVVYFRRGRNVTNPIVTEQVLIAPSAIKEDPSKSKPRKKKVKHGRKAR